MKYIKAIAVIAVILLGVFYYEYSGSRIVIHQLPPLPMTDIQTFGINDETILPCKITQDAVISPDGEKEYDLKCFKSETLGRRGLFLQHSSIFQLSQKQLSTLSDSAYVKVTYSNGITHKVPMKNIPKYP